MAVFLHYVKGLNVEGILHFPCFFDKQMNFSFLYEFVYLSVYSGAPPFNVIDLI